MAKIYVGPPSGGSGGGGSVNPTSGIMPVNLFGSFVDSLIASGIDVGNGTLISINDAIKYITVKAGTSFIDIDGVTDQLDINGINGINLNGGVFVNNHLGLDILRFLSNGSSHAAIKVVGNRLTIRNGNDTADNELTALNVIATNQVITQQDFVTNLKSILTSLTNGNFTLYNAAKSAFSLLQFGGISNLFPALKRNGATLQCRTADDLAFADFTANGIISDSGNISSSNTAIQLRVSGTTSIMRGSANGVQIANGATTPNASAQLEIISTTRGFRPPTMTALQRTAIATPAVGLMVYQTDGGAAEGIWTYKLAGWVQGV